MEEEIKKLEKLKLEEELKQLKKQNSQNNLKLILSTIGALAILIGLYFDRINNLEQRRYEFEKLQFEKRVTRMTEIAEDYNGLFSQTVGVLSKNRSRTWLLITNMLMLNQELRDLETKNQEIIELKEYVEEVINNLSKGKASVDEWADALHLEDEWTSRKIKPTPDFEQYFGKELLSQYDSIPELAISALDAEYSLSGTHTKEKLEKFRLEGTKFQALLYEKINDEYQK